MTRSANARARTAAAVHIDKRRSERTPLVIRVDYSAVDSLFSDFTRDINEGGLFIETDEPCAIDTLVKLNFDLPTVDEPIRVQGRVVWVTSGDQPGMGIEFEDLDSTARARINNLVRALRNDPVD